MALLAVSLLDPAHNPGGEGGENGQAEGETTDPDTCPFCGQRHPEVKDNPESNTWRIVCQSCGCSTKDFPSRE